VDRTGQRPTPQWPDSVVVFFRLLFLPPAPDPFCTTTKIRKVKKIDVSRRTIRTFGRRKTKKRDDYPRESQRAPDDDGCRRFDLSFRETGIMINNESPYRRFVAPDSSSRAYDLFHIFRHVIYTRVVVLLLLAERVTPILFSDRRRLLSYTGGTTETTGEFFSTLQITSTTSYQKQ